MGDTTLDPAYLTKFIKFLGHERFCIKSIQTGEKGAQEAHFDLINANKAVDHIRLRNGKRQLWANVQRLKKDTKKYHDHTDVDAYTNIFLDIDANKPDDRKDYAATDEERNLALAELATVREWIAKKGFKPGLAIKSGNGGGLFLPIPPTPPEPEFIAKVAAFLKLVKNETNCDVDTTTFDPPRVCGILRTWNVKLEDEAEGRKNHRRESIGNIPTRDEDNALLDFINGLDPDPDALATWTKKYNEPTSPKTNTPKAPTKGNGGVDIDYVKTKLDTLLEADPKLQSLINWSKDEQKRHASRSEGEYGLVGKLLAVGFSDPEIDWIMCNVSKIGKWAEEGDHYRYAETLNNLKASEAAKAEDVAALLADLPERCKADPRVLKDPTVLDALLTLQDKDPIEYDLVFDGLPKAIKRKSLKKALELREKAKKAEERQHVTDRADWQTKGITEKAEAIMAEGDPIQYLIFQAQRNHLGDINYQKVLLLSLAASNSLTSQGIHPGGTGEKGSGKTDAMKATFHLFPDAPWKQNGSLSNLAPFYMDLPPGTIIFSDDIDWDLVGSAYKRATGNYQEGYTHNTISSDRKPISLNIPPRMTWWLTSVESTHKDQENDRQYQISPNQSDSHKKEVANEIAKRRARKERRLDVDEGVLVARAIVGMIKDHDPFSVLIPQAENAEWKLYKDFRGQERFWDVVEAFAILRFSQREIDEDGWLIAEDQDIKDAIALFKADKASHATKLTKPETALVGVMLEGGTFTQAMLARKLGIAQQTISERLRAIMGRTKYITMERGSRGEQLYAVNVAEEIDPAHWENFELIKVGGLEESATSELTPHLHPTYTPLTGIPTGIDINNSGRIPISLQVKKTKGCEEKKLAGQSKLKDAKIKSPGEKPVGPVKIQNQQQAPHVSTCKGTCKGAVSGCKDPEPATGGGCKSDCGEAVSPESATGEGCKRCDAGGDRFSDPSHEDMDGPSTSQRRMPTPTPKAKPDRSTLQAITDLGLTYGAISLPGLTKYLKDPAKARYYFGLLESKGWKRETVKASGLVVLCPPEEVVG